MVPEDVNASVMMKKKRNENPLGARSYYAKKREVKKIPPYYGGIWLVGAFVRSVVVADGDVERSVDDLLDALHVFADRDDEYGLAALGTHAVVEVVPGFAEFMEEVGEGVRDLLAFVVFFFVVAAATEMVGDCVREFVLHDFGEGFAEFLDLGVLKSAEGHSGEC